jgi:hypothetical protein
MPAGGGFFFSSMKQEWITSYHNFSFFKMFTQIHYSEHHSTISYFSLL